MTAATGGGLVLIHGAGGNARAPPLVALDRAFAARGLTVLRYDVPFRQARPKGPPRPDDDCGNVVHAIVQAAESYSASPPAPDARGLDAARPVGRRVQGSV